LPQQIIQLKYIRQKCLWGRIGAGRNLKIVIIQYQLIFGGRLEMHINITINGIKNGESSKKMDINAIYDKCVTNHIQQKECEFIPFLQYVIDTLPQRKMCLEIGVCDGGTSAAFTQLFETVYAIDIEQKENCKLIEYNNKNFHFIIGNSHTQKTFSVVSEMKFDLIFIDGDHSRKGVTSDYEMYHQLLNRQGIIAFHDIMDKAVTRLIGCEVGAFWRHMKHTTEYIVNEFIYTDEPTPKDKKMPIFNFGTFKNWGGIGVLTQKY
jgi:predicted O-methyltransferase YrrM